MKKLILICTILVGSIAFGMEPALDAAPDLVTFELPDNSTEKVLKKFVVQSSTLKAMLEDTGNNTLPVPAPIQDSFGLIMPYFKFAYMGAARAMGKENEKLAALREKLAEHTEEELVKITNASTYLDIPLIRCETIALLANRLTDSARINRCLQDGSYRLNTTNDILRALAQEMIKEDLDLKNYWKLKSKCPTRILSVNTTSITPCRPLSSGKNFFASCNNEGIQVWKSNTKAPLHHINPMHPETHTLSFNHNDTMLASGHGNLDTPGMPGALNLWDIHTGNQIGASINFPAAISSLRFNNGSTMLAVGLGNGTIQLCNPQTGSQIGNSLNGHLHAINILRFNNHGNLLASSANGDLTIRLWNPQLRSQVGSFVACNSAMPSSLGFNPNGLVTATTIRFIGQGVGICSGRHLDLEYDDVYIVPEGNPNTKVELCIYDPERNTKTYKEFDPEFGIHSAILNDECTLIASGNCRGKLNFFNPDSGVKLTTIEDENFYKYGCNNWIMCFNSDSSELLAGTAHGHIKIISFNKQLLEWFSNGITADQVALIIFLKNQRLTATGHSDEIPLPEALDLVARPSMWKSLKNIFS